MKPFIILLLIFISFLISNINLYAQDSIKDKNTYKNEIGISLVKINNAEHFWGYSLSNQKYNFLNKITYKRKLNKYYLRCNIEFDYKKNYYDIFIWGIGFEDVNYKMISTSFGLEKRLFNNNANQGLKIIIVNKESAAASLPHT